MRDELDKQLCEKYPRIFKNRDLGMDESCMFWGFSCGDGWYQILDSLCAQITHHIEWKRKQRTWDLLRTRAKNRGRDALLKFITKGKAQPSDWDIERVDQLMENDFDITPKVHWVVADQVKEKFGGLRFYYHGGDDAVSGMVRMAESWAANTCENCGAVGTLRHGGWVRTLCDTHEAEYQEKQKKYRSEDE